MTTAHDAPRTHAAQIAFPTWLALRAADHSWGPVLVAAVHFGRFRLATYEDMDEAAVAAFRARGDVLGGVARAVIETRIVENFVRYDPGAAFRRAVDAAFGFGR